MDTGNRAVNTWGMDRHSPGRREVKGCRGDLYNTINNKYNYFSNLSHPESLVLILYREFMCFFFKVMNHMGIINNLFVKTKGLFHITHNPEFSSVL